MTPAPARILITGGRGQVGRALSRLLGAAPHEAPGSDALDVTDARAVDAVIARFAPDVVVHAAALTDTARCEREPQLAHLVNASGAENVARACAAAGVRLVAVSTNEVFDGKRRTPYQEDDAPRPVNAYGESKASGERLVAAACPGALIVRTSWVYGDGGANFVAKVLAAASSGKPLRMVTDEVASPTCADDLAAAILALGASGAARGVYHLANEGEASRYEWAREIVRLSGIVAGVERTTTAELRAGGYDGPRKPPYSVLANERARAIGITLRPWRDALASHMQRARVATDG